MSHAARSAAAMERNEASDLFAHADLEAARAAVSAAQLNRDKAEAAVRRAYNNGLLKVRSLEFIAATSDLLRAEGHLKMLEARHG